MTWTEPRNWLIGETASHTLLNTHLRDNLNDIFTYGDASWPDYPTTCDPRLLTAFGVLVANQAQYMRVAVGGSVSKIRIRVGVASGNISVAVYGQSLNGIYARPSTRLQTSGSVACPAAGTADVTLGGSVILGRGVNWFAISANNATASFGHGGFIIPATSAFGLQTAQAAAHPLPNPAVPVEADGSFYVLMGVP